MYKNPALQIGLNGLLLTALTACTQPQAHPPTPPGNVLVLEVSTTTPVQAVKAQIQYDPNRLEYLGVTESPMLVVDHNGKGSVRLGAISIKTNHKLFSLAFQVKSPGTAPELSLWEVSLDGSRPLNAQIQTHYAAQADKRYSLPTENTTAPLSVPGPSTLAPSFADSPLGDFDQSGDITVADALGVLQVATGRIPNPTDYQRYHSDLNSSGTISTVDAVIALRKAVDPDLEAGLEIAPQSMSLALGETRIILVGNSGNQPLPPINVTSPPGLSISDVTPQGAAGRVYQVSATSAVQNGAIILNAASAGTRVIAVNATGSVEGNGCPDPNEPNNDAASATPLTPGTLRAGICEINDVDFYTFALEAPKVVTLDVNARLIGTPLDSWVDLYDSSGTLLATNDDAQDPSAAQDSYMSILLPPGTYHVAVSDFAHEGGAEYFYDLTFTLSDPDPTAIYEAQAGVVNQTWSTGESFNGNLFELAGYTGTGDPLPYGVLVNVTAPNGASIPIPFNQPIYGKPGISWGYIEVDFNPSGSTLNLPYAQPLRSALRKKPQGLPAQSLQPVYVVSASQLEPQGALGGVFTFDFAGVAGVSRSVDATQQVQAPQNVAVIFNGDGTATVLFAPVPGAVEYTFWVWTESGCYDFIQVDANHAPPITADFGGCTPLNGEPFHASVYAADFAGYLTTPVPVPNQQIDVGTYYLDHAVTLDNTIRGTVSQGLPTASTNLEAPESVPQASAARPLPANDRVVVLFERTALRLPMTPLATEVEAFATQVQSFAAGYGLEVLSIPTPTVGLAVLRAPNGDAVGTALRLKADFRVKAAAPDYWRFPAAVPNDPYFDALWGMWGVINAPTAWEVTTGDPGVVVAVIDTGMGGPEHAGTSGDPTVDALATRGYHEDLMPNLVDGYDFVSCYDVSEALSPELLNQYPRLRYLDADDQCGYDPYPIEEYALGGDGSVAPWGGHGTHVAGTIGAVGDNGTGVAGVNWNVSIQMLRALGTLGGFSSDIITAALYAAGIPVDADGDPSTPETVTNPTPARVINMSMGGESYSEVEDQVFSMLFNDYGVLLVAAAGNGASDAPNYPAAYPAVMSVASVDYIYDVDGDPANGNQPAYAFTHSFSSYGPYIDVAAPGGFCWNTGADYQYASYPSGTCFSYTNPEDYHAPFILSTVWEWYDSTGNRSDRSTYGFFIGTSMASPHVAGAAALLFSLNPNLTPYQVREILRQTATDVDDSHLLGFGAPGRDDYYGWGVLNLAGAVEAVNTGRIPSQPAGMIYVVAYNTDTGEAFTTTADDAGFYRLNQLPDGTYQVSAWMDVNGNGVQDAGEPFGSYPDLVPLAGGLLADNISFTLQP